MSTSEANERRGRRLALDAAAVREFERTIAGGGVAVFPADTVYGLACSPTDRAAVERLYEIKGRPPAKPSAVMFFDRDRALAELDFLGERTRRACERLLPGGVTLLVPNPRRLWPLACGPQPEVLGVRVPCLEGTLAPLAGARVAVLQSSANLSGASDVRSLDALEPAIAASVDLLLDGGELPGTPSTVIDLTEHERSGAWRIVRQGAVDAARVAELLDG